MDSFTAIDFETAQGYRWSICQIGLVRIEKMKIVKELSILVQPPNNYYWWQFINIHGIRPEHTKHSPTFKQVWNELEPYIQDQEVVAHNGFRFDFPVLQQTLSYYQLPQTHFQGHCTYQIFGKKLSFLCQKFDIPLNHHDALSDAQACATLFMKYLKKG